MRGWKESGLSCAVHASREKLRASTLSWWARKLRTMTERAGRVSKRKRERSRVEDPKSVPFVEVAPAKGSGCLVRRCIAT